MLIRGNKISNVTLNVDPTDLPTLNMNVVGKAFQIMSENIFGTPTSIENIPYAHWESSVQVDSVEQTTNQFENLSLVIENTIQGNFVVGSPIKGVSSKDPVTDEKSFLGRLDTGSTPNTDITVTVKNNQPTVEYMVESVL